MDALSQIPLEHIVAHLPGYIFWKDRERRFIGCNNNLARLAGLKSPADLIGKRAEDFNWGKHETSVFERNDSEIMRTGIPKININEFLEGPDGKKFMMLVSKVPLKDQNGEIIGIIGIASDITHYKSGSMQICVGKKDPYLGKNAVRIFNRIYSSSRYPYALRCITRILLLSPSTNPSLTLLSG